MIRPEEIIHPRAMSVHVAAWAAASPDQVTKRLHNMLLRDDSLMARLRVLDQLFAESAPVGRGVYRHHDGMRS